MKKLSTCLFLIFFSFSAPSFADDISEFQIEGISIGDSLLDFFTKEEINNKKIYQYKSKKYVQYVEELKNSNYDSLVVEFIDSGKYIVGSVIGQIFYNNKDFNKCFKEERTILADLKKLFRKNADYKYHGIVAHEADPSGKSKGSWNTFQINDGSGWIYLECMDWSEEMELHDSLKITILGLDFGEFLKTEAY